MSKFFFFFRDGCSVDAAPTYFNHLKYIPCKDVSPEGDAYDAFVQHDIAADGFVRNNVTRWSRFRSFLDHWQEANDDAPLLTKKQTDMDINYLRKYGCDYGVSGVDDDGCCAYCGEGSCGPGYTYAGQFVFDKELLASAYPDFNPICSASPCGNTCCVPSNGTAQAMAGG